jgi:hypothetical protein
MTNRFLVAAQALRAGEADSGTGSYWFLLNAQCTSHTASVPCPHRLSL